MLMKTCNVSYFSSKKNLQLYWKWQTFKWKSWPFFTTSKKKKKKKKETCFSYNTFAYYVCWEVQFSSRIYRGGIKTFFVIFEGLFEWWVDQTRVGSCEFKNKVASCNKNYNLQH